MSDTGPTLAVIDAEKIAKRLARWANLERIAAGLADPNGLGIADVVVTRAARLYDNQPNLQLDADSVGVRNIGVDLWRLSMKAKEAIHIIVLADVAEQCAAMRADLAEHGISVERKGPAVPPVPPEIKALFEPC